MRTIKSKILFDKSQIIEVYLPKGGRSYELQVHSISTTCKHGNDDAWYENRRVLFAFQPNVTKNHSARK